MYIDTTWVVACTDDRKLRLMLRHLPEEPYGWLDELLVITHRDRPDDLIRCEKVIEHWRPDWPFRVRSDEEERQAIIDADLPKACRTFFEHSLGIKLAIPLTVQSPLLFTDDDIVVTQDPGYLLEDGYMHFSRSGLDGYTDTPKDLEGIAALNETFGLDLSVEEYNERRTDEAAWYIPRVGISDFVDRLGIYFETKHLQRITLDEGTAPYGHTQRFRKCGMRFWSGWVNYQGPERAKIMTSADYRALAQKDIPKRVPRATFIHYCASGQKERYMEWLQRSLDGR